MSVNAVMSIWQAFLTASPFNIPAVYLDSYPAPYVTGTPLKDGSYLVAVYPFVVVQPRSQRTVMTAAGEQQRSGLYRLIYVDQVGATYTDKSDLEAAGRAFADQLTTYLGTNAQTRSLNQPAVVFWAGKGQGVYVGLDEAGYGIDDMDRESWALPIDLEVREQFENAY